MWRRAVVILLLALGGLLLPAVAAQAAPVPVPAPAPVPLPAPAPGPDGGVAPAPGPDGGVTQVRYQLPRAPGPSAPVAPTVAPSGGSIGININGTNPDGSKPATSLVIVLGLTLLSVAPAMLLLCTCFTKVFMVLGITRNALGLTAMPPNQVLAGLALFISMFIMSPIISQVNEQGVQPYLAGDKTQSEAFRDGVAPLREFMSENTRKDELALMIKVSRQEQPDNPADVELTTLIPAFVLSELRDAFIIGFVIFVPFLIIDMVVSASLMSLGMMMLPPVTVAMPFKLLLFVLVNGWGLIITALVGSYP